MRGSTVVYFYFESTLTYTLFYFLDINECHVDNGGCSQICTNTEGSFECFCREGYILDGDGKNCLGTRVIYIHIVYFIFTDINECAESNGGCSHNCNNTEGSFECSCREGYLLHDDGRQCRGTKTIYMYM